MFPFNDFAGSADGAEFRPLSGADRRRRGGYPDRGRGVISDPLNTSTGPGAAHFERLREAGVPVVETDLNRLRASIRCGRGCGIWGRAGWAIAPMRAGCPTWVGARLGDAEELSAMLNFNANHRKELVVDRAMTGSLVTSANPHRCQQPYGVGPRFSGQRPMTAWLPRAVAAHRELIRSGVFALWPKAAKRRSAYSTAHRGSNWRCHDRAFIQAAPVPAIGLDVRRVLSGPSIRALERAQGRARGGARAVDPQPGCLLPVKVAFPTVRCTLRLMRPAFPYVGASVVANSATPSCCRAGLRRRR
ncbi:hypothetical protein DSL92_08365 [Billgrantia gudaonensis]|uniref:Uncharacterized protein n=1 Tax=Billgrantia gudaonensis TaxID=376427 RepID=A0A3S0Q0S2_9GAMM|nr:hypothetical protein DSL92_08365 [Halomonas gudaonensis]